MDLFGPDRSMRGDETSFDDVALRLEPEKMNFYDTIKPLQDLFLTIKAPPKVVGKTIK